MRSDVREILRERSSDPGALPTSVSPEDLLDPIEPTEPTDCLTWRGLPIDSLSFESIDELRVVRVMGRVAVRPLNEAEVLLLAWIGASSSLRMLVDSCPLDAKEVFDALDSLMLEGLLAPDGCSGSTSA